MIPLTSHSKPTGSKGLKSSVYEPMKGIQAVLQNAGGKMKKTDKEDFVTR